MEEKWESSLVSRIEQKLKQFGDNLDNELILTGFDKVYLSIVNFLNDLEEIPDSAVLEEIIHLGLKIGFYLIISDLKNIKLNLPKVEAIWNSFSLILQNISSLPQLIFTKSSTLIISKQ